ncbi:BQ2448_133 [Microbotryum intermedium]|uniref:BQ2448_133 protein n=1 Tax=Microbotryum intermedium TaxID=269621 RepID=A0A238F1L5_9BASI|nr:BQ2448_133 [Microbotryum intermedium]
MSSSLSEKRRSQFIHVSSPSYGGSNGAVPPLPFLPLPPEEPPKSMTATYAATPLQPQRQPSQGYVPGSLPARFGRSFSPPTSPPTPTFPYTPTVTPPVSSYGGQSGPRSFEPPEPTPWLRRLNSSDHIELNELSQLHHQPSAGTLSSRPGHTFSNRRPSPATTTSTNRQHRTQPSLTSLSSRDTHRTWSSAYSTVLQSQDRTEDSETLMMNGHSRFSGTTSIALDNEPVPPMPSEPMRFGSRLGNQGRVEPASSQTVNRDERHLGAVSTSRELSSKPTSLKTGPSSKVGGRGTGQRCCWVCLILFVVLALAGTSTALGWYFAIYKKHSSSITSDLGTVQLPINTTSDAKLRHNLPEQNASPFAPTTPPLQPVGSSTSKPSDGTTHAPPAPAVKQHRTRPNNSTRFARSNNGGDIPTLATEDVDGDPLAPEPRALHTVGEKGLAERVHKVSAEVEKALEDTGVKTEVNIAPARSKRHRGGH